MQNKHLMIIFNDRNLRFDVDANKRGVHKQPVLDTDYERDLFHGA